MSNKHGYNEKERRMVINAIAGTAYTILKVMKHTRSMGWETMYRATIEALCQSANMLVGDNGGQEEIINRLAEAMTNGPDAGAPKPLTIDTKAATDIKSDDIKAEKPLIVSPNAIKNALSN